MNQMIRLVNGFVVISIGTTEVTIGRQYIVFVEPAKEIAWSIIRVAGSIDYRVEIPYKIVSDVIVGADK